MCYSSVLQVYDLPDALDPKIPLDGNYFFNGVFLAGALLLPKEPDRVFIDAQTVAALHAPTSKQWTDEMDYYLFLGMEHILSFCSIKPNCASPGGADNDYNDPSEYPPRAVLT